MTYCNLNLHKLAHVETKQLGQNKYIVFDMVQDAEGRKVVVWITEQEIPKLHDQPVCHFLSIKFHINLCNELCSSSSHLARQKL